MRTLVLRDAKASLSAVVVPVQQATRLYPTEQPSFAALLTGISYAVETEHDTSPLRETDL
jgi:hypothetical protein